MTPSQYRRAAELVEMIHENFQGFHPGFRGVHAQGRYYAAVFKATPEAKKLSRAVHLQGQPVPVTVRHGHSASGNPWGPAVTPSMAVKFYLPDGTVTDLIGLTIPLFFGRTPDEVLEGLKILKPDPATGKPDEKKLMQYLATRPWIANAFKIAKNLPYPVSFAQTVFHAIHAFKFVNAADEAQYARYHWEPEAGVAGQTLEELQKQPPSYLFEELEARLRKAPVVFNLVLQLAKNDDPTDDPTAPWPDDRPRVPIGRLELIRPTTVEEIGDPVMLHDPTRLTDGIEPSDDPVLAVRRGVYEVSVAHRTGGWKGRLAALERAGPPFLL
jgi:catalase